jgi:hypothetical protein
MAPPAAEKSSSQPAEVASVSAAAADPFSALQAGLLGDVALLERSVQLKDGRLTARVLRDVAVLRRAFHPQRLAKDSNGAALVSAVPALAAFFAVVQSLSAAPSPYTSCPPLCSQRIAQLLTRDDTAREAWQLAVSRREQQQQQQAAQKTDSGSAQRPQEQPMELEEESKQQQEHSKQQQQQDDGDAATALPTQPAQQQGQQQYRPLPAPSLLRCRALPLTL